MTDERYIGCIHCVGGKVWSSGRRLVACPTCHGRGSLPESEYLRVKAADDAKKNAAA